MERGCTRAGTGVVEEDTTKIRSTVNKGAEGWISVLRLVVQTMFNDWKGLGLFAQKRMHRKEAEEERSV